jgi:hypothetical protein
VSVVEGDPVAGKKRSSSGKKDKASVVELRSRLEKAEARGDRWKARAVRYREDTAELRAELKKVTKRLDKVTAQRSAARDGADRSAVPPEPPSDQASNQPDSSWTVVRLRAEARSRGLAGITGKSKAELIDLLAAT